MHISNYIALLALPSCLAASAHESISKRTASLPPVVSSVQELGVTFDTNFPNVYRDNGGGGTINGINLVVFSDTTTTSGGRNGPLEAFVSNSVAAMDYNNASDPLNLFDFGSNGNPREFIPRQANESDGTQFAIWPNSNIVELSDLTTGIAAYPVLRRDAAVGGGVTLYNTLVSIVMTLYGPVATRIVPQLFYAGEIQYGSFGIVRGIDGYLYLFAAIAPPAPGIKVARVAEGNRADRSQYTYWNGQTWASTPPAASDTSANIINYSGAFGNGPASGDIFFSSYYNTWVAIFFDAFVDGVFRLMYSTTSSFTGPWSTEQDLYTTTAEPGSWNYAGHAYPNLANGDGQHVLLSWTYGGNLTKMAEVTFQ